VNSRERLLPQSPVSFSLRFDPGSWRILAGVQPDCAAVWGNHLPSFAAAFSSSPSPALCIGSGFRFGMIKG
jgi:hypothetical protein